MMRCGLLGVVLLLWVGVFRGENSAYADDAGGLVEQLDSILKRQERPPGNDLTTGAPQVSTVPESSSRAWLYLGKVTDWQGSAWDGTPHILARSPANLAGTRARLIGDSNLRQDAALPPGRDPRGFRAAQPALGTVHDGEAVQILKTEIYPATDSGLAMWALVSR
jgi:hypothetical protein